MSRKETIPAIVTLVVGIPLISIFSSVMAKNETRRAQAPIRAMIGDQTFDALKRGEKTEQHYMGDHLLAPDFTLDDQHGRTFRLHQQRGKLVVMNFWTVTCQPCVEELPFLEHLAFLSQTREDLEVISVSADPGWKEASTVLSTDSPLRVLFDPDRSVIRDKYGTRLFPETWIIDEEGIIRLRIDGARDWSSPTSLAMIEQFL